MAWTDFTVCEKAEKTKSQRAFERRICLWLQGQRLLQDLLKALPVNTLLRVHLSDQAIHLAAIIPPMQSVMFVKDENTSIAYPNTIMRELAGVTYEQPDTGTALAFFFVEDKGKMWLLDYLHLADLVPTRTFKLEANYPIDAIEYARLLQA